MPREKAMYYDDAWRLLEERINDDVNLNSVVDRVCQQVWGGWGVRYIDDAVLRREDANADGDYIDATDTEWNYLTDAQFSVIAMVEDTGLLVERTAYTPYGQARHSFREDLDGDGDVDSADQSIFMGSYGQSIGAANAAHDGVADELVPPGDAHGFAWVELRLLPCRVLRRLQAVLERERCVGGAGQQQYACARAVSAARFVCAEYIGPRGACGDVLSVVSPGHLHRPSHMSTPRASALRVRLRSRCVVVGRSHVTRSVM